MQGINVTFGGQGTVTTPAGSPPPELQPAVPEPPPAPEKGEE